MKINLHLKFSLLRWFMKGMVTGLHFSSPNFQIDNIVKNFKKSSLKWKFWIKAYLWERIFFSLWPSIHAKNGIWIITVCTWNFTGMTFEFRLGQCVYTGIFIYHSTKNYWNDTVFFIGTNVNYYSHTAHEFSTESF